MLLLAPDGPGEVRRLGTDLSAGERPQIVIPAGTWFAAELADGATHCLFGCTVAPGFDFADFELAAGPELARALPGARRPHRAHDQTARPAELSRDVVEFGAARRRLSPARP